MRIPTKAGIGVAVALSTAMAIAAPAFADPPSGVTPRSQDIVGVGSDATQYVTDAISATYDKKHPVKNGVLPTQVYSWDAVGSSPITTKQGANPITRPAGGNAGVSALLADTSGSIDFARTTTPKKSDGSQNSLTFFALARDGVTWAAIKGTKKVPANLSAAQLKSIYTCQVTNWNSIDATLPSNPIHPFLPASTFATRTFFETAIGITDAQVGACVGTLSEQSNGTLINGDPLAILPYSISNYVAQSRKVVPNNIGGVTLRNVDGTAPLVNRVLNPAFSPTFLRLVYNVAKNTEVASNPLINQLFGSGGFFCAQTNTLKKYGLGSLGTACGATS